MSGPIGDHTSQSFSTPATAPFPSAHGTLPLPASEVKQSRVQPSDVKHGAAKVNGHAGTSSAASPPREMDGESHDTLSDSDDQSAEQPRRKKTKSACAEKQSASKPKEPPAVTFVVDEKQRHVFAWPSQMPAFVAHVHEHGFGVLTFDAPLVPNNEQLMLRALAHMGIDLVSFQTRLDACIDSVARRTVLAEALRYYLLHRCGNIGNGIVNGQVRTAPVYRATAASGKSASGKKPAPAVKKPKVVEPARTLETNVGQSEWAWAYRQHPTCVAVADALLGAGEKRVGFDSVNVGGTGRKAWYHIDVNIWPYQEDAERIGVLADVQMMHNARACTVETGGFVCKPGSHKHHRAVVERLASGGGPSASSGSTAATAPSLVAASVPNASERPEGAGSAATATPSHKRKRRPSAPGARHNQNFLRLPVDPQTGQYREPLMSSIDTLLVTAPANSITVWSSALIHCNGAGTKVLKKSTVLSSLAELFPRSIVYFSYYPAALCRASDARRIDLFNAGVTTNHSPIDASAKKAAFRDKPHNLPIAPYVPVRLSALGRDLIAPLDEQSRLNNQSA